MKLKVFYYNFKFWRAEAVRAGLFLQNIPFEDIRDKEEMAAVKPRAPFGAFPIIEVDGQILSQTQAIVTYVGKLGSVFDFSSVEGASADPSYPRLYPADDNYFLQAKCDEIINGCTEVTGTITSSFGLPKDEVEPKRKALIAPDGGRLYKHCSGLNSICCNESPGLACGKTMTVADLCVWKLVNWLSGGILDHIPADFVSSNFPNLQAIFENCESNEKIKEYVKLYHK
jgi:glutathione S-transferase